MNILTASLIFLITFIFLFSLSLWPVLLIGSENRARWFLAANVINALLVFGMFSSMRDARAECEKKLSAVIAQYSETSEVKETGK